MLQGLLSFIGNMLRRIGCKHRYRYSRSKPGTLVCRDCGHRRRPESQVFR